MKKHPILYAIYVALVLLVVLLISLLLPSVTDASCIREPLFSHNRTVIQLRRPQPVMLSTEIQVFYLPKGEAAFTLPADEIVVMTYITNHFIQQIHGENWIFIESMHEDWSVRYFEFGMTLVGNLNICNRTIGWVKESDLFPEKSQ